MYLALRCSACKDTSNVPFTKLYALWKADYDRLCAAHKKKKTQVMATVQCPCGQRDKFDTPMFRYVFKVIFDEYLKQDTRK